MLLGFHSAMIEDLLTRAEHFATGAPLDYPRIPGWVRALNAVEIGWWRWRGKLPPAETENSDRRRGRAVAAAAWLVPPTLLALGALHALWALGSAWPAENRASLAHWVLGDGASVPSAAACWTVAALLTGGAGAVHVAGRGARSRHLPPILWATAAALLARGAVYPPMDLTHLLASDFDRVDLAIYSPLCLLLGLGALTVARDLPRQRSASSVDAGDARRANRT